MNREELRQIVEGSASMAQIMANYYFELKQCGMEPKEALQMAIAYQHSIITMNKN